MQARLITLFFIVLTTVISCEGPAPQFNSEIHKGQATFDYNATDWEAEARVKPFRTIGGTEFVHIQLETADPDQGKTERLRFFIPKGERGSTFTFTNAPPRNIFVTEEAVPNAIFFAFASDLMLECYAPYSVNEDENFVHIDEITDQGEYVGRFQISFALDSLSRGIGGRIRPDTFSLLNGSFRAFSEL